MFLEEGVDWSLNFFGQVCVGKMFQQISAFGFETSVSFLKA
jgi:hypothetical protein